MPIETLTFGCRLNTYESAVMAERAAAAGVADALLVNTCAVTHEAVRQARQAIRRARREDPGRRIVVAGCAAQTDPEIFAAMPEVDLVLGNKEKLALESYRPLAGRSLGATNNNVVIAVPGLDPGINPAIHSVKLENTLRRDGMDARIESGHDDTGKASPRATAIPSLPNSFLAIPPHEKILVGDIASVRETASHMLKGFSRARAFVQVQNGCDHRCTFCIIPYGRGPSRSVPMGAVVDEIRRLTEKGFREAVLTGVDITAWGADLPGRPRLGSLVRKILKLVPELQRLRLSSIDSVEADDELVRAFAEEERLMPHLHLSLQSGDDIVLKRMKRRHSRADAIRFCAELRKLRPDIVFGADLIAGFPTETEKMFENTLSAVEECGLTFLHVFPYSPRKNTPAARMPQLGPGVAQERARSLRQKGDSALSAWMSSEVGKARKILVEGGGRGHTEHYAPVEIDGGKRGEIVSARIAGFSDKRLSALMIPAAA